MDGWGGVKSGRQEAVPTVRHFCSLPTSSAYRALEIGNDPDSPVQFELVG
jgi:hypothetical protein